MYIIQWNLRIMDTLGSGILFFYREVVLSLEVNKCTSMIEKKLLGPQSVTFIERFFGLSFI